MKKYVLVGCGSRGTNAYAIPLVRDFSDHATLAAVYDTNAKRARRIQALLGENIRIFDDFEKMIAEIEPDTVIVTSPDSTHDKYIIKAMDMGCNVICEKPLTTDFEKAVAIIEAKSRTGKELTVTFNLRFSPFFKRIKELVVDGVIGDILSIHYEWMLDTRHGADYFRRWHRRRENSGSLLVHKSTHHFDIANWLLEQDPVSVNAFGTRRFYGPTREDKGDRCLDCPHRSKCEFFLDITRPEFKSLYFDCEDADGYFRDRCVFSEEIDIEDSVSVNILYSGGAVMSYSLIAHSPYEGFRMILNGTKGRMEVEKFSSEQAGYKEEASENIHIFNRCGEDITVPVPQRRSEGHGGADGAMREFLFKGIVNDRHLGQAADLRAGLMSIGIGISANISMKENMRVDIPEFIKEVKRGR